jgi:hypothetical protein
MRLSQRVSWPAKTSPSRILVTQRVAISEKWISIAGSELFIDHRFFITPIDKGKCDGL